MFLPARLQRHTPTALALLVAVLAVLAKLALTSGALLPGLDGAYYWVQVRALVERGSLAFSDLPLLFWLQAGMAWLAKVVSGQTFDVVIPFVVRLTDALLPSLVVLPLLALERRWERPWLAPLLTLVVLFHPVQLYFFTGDFLKNEAALPLAVALAALLITSDRRPAWKTITAGGVVFAVAATTHFGVLLLCVALVGFWALFRWLGWSWKARLVSVATVVVAVSLVVAALGFWAPSRLERLVATLSDAGSLFRNSVWEVSGFQPGTLRMPLLFALVSGQVGSVVLAAVAFWYRRDLGKAGPALAALLVTAWGFSSPFLGLEWFDRLAALSFVPLVLAAGLLATGHAPKVRRLTWAIGGVLASAALLVSAVLVSQGPTPPALASATWQELQVLAKSTPLPERSLIVARHGVEFLAAWLWRTDVVQDRYAGPDASQGYERTYLLIDLADEGRGGAGAPNSDKKPPEGLPPRPPEDASGKGSGPPEGAKILYQSPTLLFLQAPTP